MVDTLNQLCSCDLLKNEDAVYRSQAYRRKRAVLSLKKVIEHDDVLCMLRSTNPSLWARLWLTLAKSALFRPIDLLTSSQRKERYRDQEEICNIFAGVFKEINRFSLYFPTSFEADAYPESSSMRCLIEEALNLLRVMGGSTTDVVKKDPPLLIYTMQLRRSAYRDFTRALFTECIDHQPYDKANDMTVSIILYDYPFMCAHRWNWDDNDELKVVSPPPPPPQADLVRRALDELTTRDSVLARSSITFIMTYLSFFFIRPRGFAYVRVDPSSVALPIPRSDSPTSEPAGLMLDPFFNCLSSEENFTLDNLVYNLNKPFL